MASGFSYHGGRSRCFAHWQEFAKCYAQTDNPHQCRPPAEDYLECLHHTKEIDRAKTVQSQFVKYAQQQTKEHRKATDILADGVVVGLGLISKDKAGEEGKS
ncbi:hypothetical protein BU17DRAFT_63268 [Hysterangium stoloniferum]|nr:hypothetical protein BU17DRAFT_63268 [Hysterangium stoloniferum]